MADEAPNVSVEDVERAGLTLQHAFGSKDGKVRFQAIKFVRQILKGSTSFVPSLLRLLGESAKSHDSIEIAMLLLELNVPRWLQGGEHFGHAIPVETLSVKALEYLDQGPIDFNTLGAVLIGMYGPEAEAILPELIKRLELHWRDCSRAPGITWAVYMIGGLRPEILTWMRKLATDTGACPHAKMLAVRILKMNQVEIS